MKNNHNIDINDCNDDIKTLFYQAKHNPKHEAIVGTAYNFILTTNYDNLLEQAAKKLNYYELVNHAYTYTQLEQVSSCVYDDKSAIVHAHGRIGDLDFGEYVLTSDDYFNIMKRNPGLGYILNTIFMSDNIVFVGYGASDPHFEDILTDVNKTLKWNNSNNNLPRYYIVLRKDNVTPILLEYKKPVRTEIVEVDDYDEVLEILEALRNECPRLI